MIWRREQLLELSEAEFRDQVVIPLFRAMGYQDVRSHHGGPIEQGKDVVMWRVNQFGTRRNSAVVVKAERIGGSASTLAQTALSQILQALGSPFLDDVTREEHRVHEVQLVNSHDISTEALLSYKSALQGSNADHRVDFIFGDRLWQLLRKHLPRQLIFASLADAQRALAEADPHYGFVIQVGPGATHFMIVPQSADAPPLQASFEPNFPDTEEGRDQLRAFERFLKTGQSAKINSSYLTVRGLPASADFLVTSLGGGTIHLGPSTLAGPILASLLIVPKGSPEVVLLPYVEFGSNRGGSEEVMVSNEQQHTPYKVALTAPRDNTRPGNFGYVFSAAQASAFTYYKALLIQAQLSIGGMLVYEDLFTGRRHGLFEVAPGEIAHPGEEYLELWGNVAEIQRRTGTVIPVPERQHFTEGDISKIFAVLAILRDGAGKENQLSLAAGITAAGVKELLSRHPDGILGEFIAETSEYMEEILDVSVPLGPAGLHLEQARIPESDLARIVAEADRLAENPEAVIQVPIESVEGCDVTAKFPKWSPD